MCLAVLALRTLPGIPVLIAANRDEFHERPTLPAAQWPDAPDIYAGRDGRAGGTWMGVSARGRYALVTNFREPGHFRDPAPSRGALVEDYLRGAEPPAAYLARVHRGDQAYNGFNLIVGDARSAWYLSNRDGGPRELAPASMPCPTICWTRPGPSSRAPRRRSARCCAAARSPTCPRSWPPWPTASPPTTPTCPPPACRWSAKDC